MTTTREDGTITCTTCRNDYDPRDMTLDPHTLVRGDTCLHDIAGGGHPMTTTGHRSEACGFCRTGREHPQEVTTGGEPIVRTSVRPQAEHSPPPVVTPEAGAGEQGKAPAPAPFTCRIRRCATYAEIVVGPPTHGVHRVTFHGDLVGVYAPFDAALVVTGLHAGAHLEAARWRWVQREEP